jgi:hypothetical protein
MSISLDAAIAALAERLDVIPNQFVHATDSLPPKSPILGNFENPKLFWFEVPHEWGI